MSLSFEIDVKLEKPLENFGKNKDPDFVLLSTFCLLGILPFDGQVIIS